MQLATPPDASAHNQDQAKMHGYLGCIQARAVICQIETALMYYLLRQFNSPHAVKRPCTSRLDTLSIPQTSLLQMVIEQSNSGSTEHPHVIPRS